MLDSLRGKVGSAVPTVESSSCELWVSIRRSHRADRRRHRGNLCCLCRHRDGDPAGGDEPRPAFYRCCTHRCCWFSWTRCARCTRDGGRRRLLCVGGTVGPSAHPPGSTVDLPNTATARRAVSNLACLQALESRTGPAGPFSQG